MTSTVKSLMRWIGLGDFGGVQPVNPGIWVGQAGGEGSLYLTSSQSVQVVREILRKSRLCPSGSLYLKELKMSDRVDFIWLPIDRVALLLKVSVKTIRRMIKDNKLIALLHQIPTVRGKTLKTFILADEQLIQLEFGLYMQTLIRPDLWFEEEIILGNESNLEQDADTEEDAPRYNSVFLVFMDNELMEKADVTNTQQAVRKIKKNEQAVKKYVSLR
ncbi:MAG: hypothetical protein Q8J62_06100 [Candidatus Cloacimonadaceae bacterium]|nr:hypothetical protein [Candidatus Cloacimonadaceae bacterium]